MTVKDVDANSHRGDLSSTDKRDVYYKYDLRGLPLYARFNSATGPGSIMTYDGAGQMLTATSSLIAGSPMLEFQYDKDGNRTRITHADGAQFDMVYDGLDRFTTAFWQTPTIGSVQFTAVSYYPSGKRKTINRASSYTNYFFDNDQRLSQLQQTYNSGNGNVMQSFQGYNAAGQLLQSLTDNTSYSFSGRTADTIGYAANGLNQYSTVRGGNYCYDDNGNVIYDQDNVYRYDVENRLVERRTAAANLACNALVYTGTLKASLHYDPMGRLYEVTGTTGTTQMLYDGDRLVAEYSAAGALLRRYMWGDRTDEPILWDEGTALDCSGTHVLQTDRQGSNIAIADCWGNLNRIFRYDDYGLPQSSDITPLIPSNGARFLYTGQAFIPELGMYYYKARIYSPYLGRFMQTDPVGYEDQMNLYAYVGNDPINASDPTGKYKCGEDSDCETIKQYYVALQEAARRPVTGTRLGNSAAQSALRTLGAPGKDNGVTVSFVDVKAQKTDGMTTETTGLWGSITGNRTFSVTLRKDIIDSVAGRLHQSNNVVGATVLGHEARHVAQYRNGFSGNTFAAEVDAYVYDLSIGRALGWDQKDSRRSNKSYFIDRAFGSCYMNPKTTPRQCDNEYSDWERQN